MALGKLKHNPGYESCHESDQTPFARKEVGLGVRRFPVDVPLHLVVFLPTRIILSSFRKYVLSVQASGRGIMLLK